MTQPIKCKACGESFGNWLDLAKHISRQKDRLHKRGKRWAAKVIMKQRQLDSKGNIPNGRTPLTEEQREAKRDSRRDLSGEHERVLTICPRCKQPGGAMLEVEHTQNIDAWRIGKRLAVLCNQCRG